MHGTTVKTTLSNKVKVAKYVKPSRRCSRNNPDKYLGNMLSNFLGRLMAYRHPEVQKSLATNFCPVAPKILE